MNGEAEITSRNHGFAIERDSLPANPLETHVSPFDGSHAGLALTGKPAFSVQYCPDARPGPQDVCHLVEHFVGIMR